MKFLTIGQVAAEVGVSVETLRYYEQEGLIAKPSRTPSQYRQYTADAVHRVKFIIRAKDYGFTLKEVKELIDLYDSLSSTRQDVRDAADDKIAAIEGQIRELRATEDLLVRLRALCNGDDGPARECPILMTIAGVFTADDPKIDPPHKCDGK